MHSSMSFFYLQIDNNLVYHNMKTQCFDFLCLCLCLVGERDLERDCLDLFGLFNLK